MDEPTKPRVTVSKTGVHKTSPAEILRSEVGREIIRKTSEAVQKRAGTRSSGTAPDK